MNRSFSIASPSWARAALFTTVLAATATAFPAPAHGQTCSGWEQVPSPSPGEEVNALRGVTAFADRAWAIGTTKNASALAGPLALHWNGAAWVQVGLPDTSGLGTAFSLDAVASNGGLAWAAASVSTSSISGLQLLLRWDGGAWTVQDAVELHPATVYPHWPRVGYVDAMVALSPTLAWAVGTASGNGDATATSLALALRWDGSDWQEVTLPQVANRSHDLHGIDGTGPGNVWAVGHSRNVAGAYYGLVYHFDGASWSTVPTPALGIPQSFLQDVVAIAADDVWVVGEMPDGALFMHWDGTSWSLAPSPVATTTRIAHVEAFASDDIWAVAAFTQEYYRWDGQSWSRCGAPTVPGATGVNRAQGLAAMGQSLWSVGSYSKGGPSLTLTERYERCADAVSLCAGLPNSTGSAATMAVSGSTSLASNKLVLSASVLPANTVGQFFFGFQPMVPASPLGDGLLCLAPPVVRLPVVMAIGSTAVQQQDFSTPQYSGLPPGTVLHVQFRYRDVASQGAGYNLSEAVTLTLCP